MDYAPTEGNLAIVNIYLAIKSGILAINHSDFAIIWSDLAISLQLRFEREMIWKLSPSTLRNPDVWKATDPKIPMKSYQHKIK